MGLYYLNRPEGGRQREKPVLSWLMVLPEKRFLFLSIKSKRLNFFPFYL